MKREIDIGGWWPWKSESTKERSFLLHQSPCYDLFNIIVGLRFSLHNVTSYLPRYPDNPDNRAGVLRTCSFSFMSSAAPNAANDWNFNVQILVCQ